MLLLKSKVIREEMRVSTRFLRGYFVARLMILLGQHEHKRSSNQSTRPFLGGRKQEEVNEESYADV